MDSVFTDLNLTDLHAPLSVDNSNISIINATFTNNVGPVSGGIACSNMTQLRVDSCSFNNNYGGKPVASHCPLHADHQLVITNFKLLQLLLIILPHVVASAAVSVFAC